LPKSVRNVDRALDLATKNDVVESAGQNVMPRRGATSARSRGRFGTDDLGRILMNCMDEGHWNILVPESKLGKWGRVVTRGWRSRALIFGGAVAVHSYATIMLGGLMLVLDNKPEYVVNSVKAALMLLLFTVLIAQALMWPIARVLQLLGSYDDPAFGGLIIALNSVLWVSIVWTAAFVIMRLRRARRRRIGN